MKHKKYLALLLAAAMTMSLAACSGASQTQESSSADNSSAAEGTTVQADAETQESGDLIELTYMHKLNGT